MNLAAQLARGNARSGLTRTERALDCCHLAKELEKAGEYEAAFDALNEFWQERASIPLTDGLDPQGSAA